MSCFRVGELLAAVEIVRSNRSGRLVSGSLGFGGIFARLQQSYWEKWLAVLMDEATILTDG